MINKTNKATTTTCELCNDGGQSSVARANIWRKSFPWFTIRRSDWAGFNPKALDYCDDHAWIEIISGNPLCAPIEVACDLHWERRTPFGEIPKIYIFCVQRFLVFKLSRAMFTHNRKSHDKLTSNNIKTCNSVISINLIFARIRSQILEMLHNNFRSEPVLNWRQLHFVSVMITLLTAVHLHYHLIFRFEMQHATEVTKRSKVARFMLDISCLVPCKALS